MMVCCALFDANAKLVVQGTQCFRYERRPPVHSDSAMHTPLALGLRTPLALGLRTPLARSAHAARSVCARRSLGLHTPLARSAHTARSVCARPRPLAIAICGRSAAARDRSRPLATARDRSRPLATARVRSRRSRPLATARDRHRWLASVTVASDPGRCPNRPETAESLVPYLRPSPPEVI
jgi:hypothetical protein